MKRVSNTYGNMVNEHYWFCYLGKYTKTFFASSLCELTLNLGTENLIAIQLQWLHFACFQI